MGMTPTHRFAAAYSSDFDSRLYTQNIGHVDLPGSDLTAARTLEMMGKTTGKRDLGSGPRQADQGYRTGGIARDQGASIGGDPG
jgi:hypothetical protein